MEIGGARSRSAAILLLLVLACGCGSDAPHTPKLASTESENVMKLTSSGFEDGTQLDAKYTADGEDRSPPLAWSEAPAATRSFTLICDDPDAPSPRRPAAEPWVHWIIFNIPAKQFQLSQGMGHVALEPAEAPGARQGINSWPSDNVGYRGPAPPPGSGQHRYFFKIYALDSVLALKAGATKQQLLAAMSGHVLAEGQLVGTYER